MTNEAEVTAPETAAESDAALIEAQLAADAARDQLLREQEAARLEAEAKARRVIAQIDKDFVLVGRVDNPSDADWDAASEAVKFENGFDNALHRYKLVKYEGDKWRFEPITHAKDEGSENTEGGKVVLAPIARLLLNAKGRRAYLDSEVDADLDALESFLSSFDSMGA
jgi:hypothetical protein